MNIRQAAEAAKKASIRLASIGSETKNRALSEIAAGLQRHAGDIAEANRRDIQRAEADRLAPPLLKRLKFDARKIADACSGLQSLVRLQDPVGRVLRATQLDEGLELYQETCPIGVIGVIFESRPDALIQISALCLKSGNAVLLKGGSEAAETNRILADIVTRASVDAGIPEDWLALMETRTDVSEMLEMDNAIDLIIPRGSNAFVRHIMENTTVPVLGHADGICHVYVDARADQDMATRICVDSKCQYVAVCNAAETFLVHEAIAADFLPRLGAALAARGVEIRGCPKTAGIIDVKPATDEDWKTEYLDLTVSIRVVESLEAAVDHINTHGSGHTDVIVTGDPGRGELFMNTVDSADVFLNCSSRFSDGFRYGLGAEVGISTSKIHARGPVGLEGLVIYKWKLIGRGHIVADYTGKNGKKFTHRPLDPR